MTEQKLREILEQNVEVPDMVNRKLEETCAQLEDRQPQSRRKGPRPLRLALIAAALALPQLIGQRPIDARHRVKRHLARGKGAGHSHLVVGQPDQVPGGRIAHHGNAPDPKEPYLVFHVAPLSPKPEIAE